jgi:hypothetical protein
MDMLSIVFPFGSTLMLRRKNMRCSDGPARPPSFTILYAAACAAVLLLSAGATAQAQTTARDNSRAELAARQRALWELERMKGKLSKRPSEPRLAYEQIKEDFEQLQLLTYSLTEQSGARLDYGQIKRASADIKRRAARLKVNLSLPDPGKDEKSDKGGEEIVSPDLKVMINSLSTVVKSFVWSPIFQQPGVVDVKASAKASRDLEQILKLSEHVHKLAEVATKAADKN